MNVPKDIVFFYAGETTTVNTQFKSSKEVFCGLWTTSKDQTLSEVFEEIIQHHKRKFSRNVCLKAFNPIILEEE